jgi:hypothetical protein
MKVMALDPEKSTATVELFGSIRMLPASFYEDRVRIYGIAVRYPQGTKIWEGSVTVERRGGFGTVDTPMDHRRRWARVLIVGFYSDVPQRDRSRR